MMALKSLSLVACLGSFSPALAAPTPAAAPTIEKDLPDLVEKLEPGVVNISATRVNRVRAFGNYQDLQSLFGIPREEQISLGSGFVVEKDGHIVTNAHVVQDAREVMVTLLDKRQFHAKIVGKDAKTDVALLKIDDPKFKIPAVLTALNFGDSAKMRKGESVFAIGNPFGFLSHSVTKGIISSKDRNIGQGPYDNFFQIDASINPGNSGGPLFNLKGEVIGINSAIISKTGNFAGIAMAIPSNEAKDVIQKLKTFGRVPRPWIGIDGKSITPQITAFYDLPSNSGVIVANLIQDAPADNGGVRVGDIIVQVNGKKVESLNEIERALGSTQTNGILKVKLNRNGKLLEKEVKLEEFPPQLVERVREGII
jgi:serine protease Do